jgi:5'-nucleotidase
MVSSGDNFLAGPEFNASLEKGVPYYDGIALDLIGYDALAIGNHEFDFGPDVLEDFIRSFERTAPPFLSANLDVSGEPGLSALEAEGRIAHSTVVKVRGEYVGIVGATTEDLSFISSPRNVTVNDVLSSVQAEVDDLLAAGIDKIILVSHLQSIEEDKLLIAQLRGLDVAVAGGGDELLANADDPLLPGDVPVGPYPEIVMDADSREIPVVTTPGDYRYVGRLIVGFDKDGDVVSVDDRSGPVRVYSADGIAPDPEIQALVVEPVALSIEEQAANVIGTSGDRLNGTRALVRSQEMNMANLITDAATWMGTDLAGSFGVPVPDIAMQNGGGIRNSIVIEPGGDITELDIRRVLPFGNFVTIVEGVTTQRLKDLLENGVSAVEFGSGRFAQVGGLCFIWDPTGTPQDQDGQVITVPGTRVQKIVLGDDNCDDGVDDGPVVVDGGAVQIANDFSARGGDEWLLADLPRTSLGVLLDQAVIDYIEGPLGGLVGAADYPEFGEGRIVELP